MKSPLLQQFLDEGRELVEEASESLLLLERSPQSDEIVNQVFRSVHTLKGNSGLFEFGPLTELLHVAEELMVAVRDKTIELTPEMVDALLAAADGVRGFLDEIDGTGELGSSSIEEGRRLAEALACRFEELSNPKGVRAPGESSAPDEGPPWLAEVPQEALTPTDEGPVCAFEYRPNDTCFFRGEDPILIASRVPDVRWRSVVFDPEAPETSDPFVCRLLLRAVSAAPRSLVLDTLRYVEDEVQVWPPTADESLHHDTPSGTAPPPETCTTLVRSQLTVLEAGGDAVVPSVVEVLVRSFRGLGYREGVDKLDALPDKPSVGEVKAIIEGSPTTHSKSRSRVEDSASANQPGPAREKEAGGAVSRVLRVDQHKVDRLMNLIGQLVVAKNGLPYVTRRLESHGDTKVAARELKEHAAVVDRISRELQSAIMEVRMLPVSQVFQRFPRLVRDVCRKLNKEIELSLVGEETQADKNVIEALSEPLVHLVRNALDHAIEPPTERTAKGKPPAGQIRLSARNENETVVICVEDDGRGIDPDIIRRKAIKKGLHDEDTINGLSDDDARMLIFAPGFSTKEKASELSGRGVGMDVVRTTIEKAGGRVSLESEVGVGSRVTLSLPLSMAVSHVMTVTADGQLYGIGMDSVVETVRCSINNLRNVRGRESFVLREKLIPVLRLRSLLALSGERCLNAYDEEAVLVLRDGNESVGLIVDEFGENIEVLVRPLEGWIGQMTEYSGSAVLGDGRLLLVLDMKELIKNGG